MDKENRLRSMVLFTQEIMLIAKSKVKVLADMLMGPATLVNGTMVSFMVRAPTLKLTDQSIRETLLMAFVKVMVQRPSSVVQFTQDPGSMVNTMVRESISMSMVIHT